MARKDYRCLKCGAVHEQIHAMHDKPDPCPMCRSRRLEWVPHVPTIKPPPDSGWDSENNGRGRYIGQLQSTPGPEGSDRDAFCRSQSEAIEKAKRKGFTVTRAR